MAKFTKASEEIEKIVVEVANELNFINYGIDFEAVSVPKAKEVVQVKKASAVSEYLTKRDDLILVICYEEAFDNVDEKTKYLWIRMAMDKISFDTEKCKISLDCPSITVPVGFYEKFKGSAIDAAILGQYTIAQIEQKKKEEAAAKKALRIKGSKKKGN